MKTPLIATVLNLSRQDGWYAGTVRFSSGRPAEFFVSPSASEIRLYSGVQGGNRYGPAARLALLIALGIKPNTAAPMIEVQAKRARPVAPVMPEIANMVAASNKVTLAELRSEERSRRVAHPRQAAMWLMIWAGKSTTQVGDYFGRHHTTVMHGARAHEARLTGQAHEAAA